MVCIEGQKVYRTFQWKPIYIHELFEMVCCHIYLSSLALKALWDSENWNSVSYKLSKM